jgi:hypothetical protein
MDVIAGPSPSQTPEYLGRKIVDQRFSGWLHVVFIPHSIVVVALNAAPWRDIAATVALVSDGADELLRRAAYFPHCILPHFEHFSLDRKPSAI